MRLTPLAKLLIVLLLSGAVAALYFKRDVLFGKSGNTPAADTPADGSLTPGAAGGPEKQADPNHAPVAAGAKKRIVVGVNDFGGASAGLVANDGALPGPKSLFKAAGLDVEIRLVRGSKERLEKFESGEIDVMLLTLDYVANLYADYKKNKNQELQAFMFVDWSRGNLGIVAKPEIDSVEALKGKRIATTRNTPTHYFALTLLDRSNLKPAEIQETKGGFVFAKKTPDAGEMFKRGEVDAVAIWEPHLSRAVQEGKGKLLVSTTTASNLIADVLFARKSFLDEHQSEMPAFIRAWLAGVKKLNSDQDSAVELIAKAMEQKPEEARAALGKIKPATFADNRAFFGLETESSPYSALLEEAGEIWRREGVIDTVPNPRQVARLSFLDAIKSEYTDERVQEDWKFEKKKALAPALLSKSVSIYFTTGSAELDPNARKEVDRFAEQLAGVFQNAYVRVEGNTDNTGVRAKNVALSARRAEAVVTYLVSHHRFDPERFVAVGNGPDRPIGDNGDEHGRELNRRTDFRIVPNY